MKKIKAEKPATGILKNFDFGNAMYYTIVCQCGSPTDNVEFILEVDRYNITMNTEFTPKTAYWKNLIDENSNIENTWLWSLDIGIRSFINGLYHRFMVTWEVWTKGYVKYYQTTIMTEQQAINYAATIYQSVEDLKKFKEGNV